MKLLVVTQKVDKNDDNLGFFHGWLEEFARKAEKLTVICLFEGEHSLQQNTRVFSLGKEGGGNKFTYLLRLWWLVWKESKNYDSVFVHMNPIYAVAAGICWRLLGKRIVLWYAHGGVTGMLKTAHALVHKVATSTKEGFRIPSKKVEIVGQGIDTSKFLLQKGGFNKGRLVTVGRVTKSKRIEVLIDALKIVRENNTDVSLQVVGGLGETESESYLNDLKKRSEGNPIEFVGSVSHSEIAPIVSKAEVFVSAGATGSLDKVIVEAMALGVPVVTSNEAASSVLSKWRDSLVFETGNATDLAFKVKRVLDMSSEGRDRLSQDIREIVVRDHSLHALIDKIMALLVLEDNENAG